MKTAIKRKILITIPWFLPAYRAGGPVRSIANLVDSFSGADFYIFTSDREITGKPLEGISTGEWIRWNECTKVWYADSKQKTQKLISEVREIKPDVIFMIGLYSWYFTVVPLIFCPDIKKIISVRGMLHPGALAQKSFKKKIFIGVMKMFGVGKKFIFHATDREEEQYIQYNLGTSTRICVAGNYPTRLGFLPVEKKNKGFLKLVSICLISPMKNILMVLKELKQITANIEYNIYGSIKDEAYWEKCRSVITELPSNISVFYRGAVSPEEIKSALTHTHLFILPSESENFGHAIFESLSAGRPAVTSFATPYRNLEKAQAGINIHPGENGEIGRSINFFARMDEAELGHWSEGAFRYSEDFYNPQKLEEEYLRLFS